MSDIFVIFTPLLSVGDLNRAANAFNVKITPHMVTTGTMQTWFRQKLQALIDTLNAMPDDGMENRHVKEGVNQFVSTMMSVPLAFQHNLDGYFNVFHMRAYEIGRNANPNHIVSIHGGQGVPYTVGYVDALMFWPEEAHGVPITHTLMCIVLTWSRGKLSAIVDVGFNFMTGPLPRDFNGRRHVLWVEE